MIEKEDIKKIKEIAEEFFLKMTFFANSIQAILPSEKASPLEYLWKTAPEPAENKDAVDLDIILEEPQILIGEKGQTLFEIQKLLRLICNKKIQKIFYLNFDINGYKKKKTEYLKKLAKESADEVSATGREKSFFPMPAYERKIIHAELAKRNDVLTESRGADPERYIIIKLK